MADIVPKQTNKKAPEVQDLSELVDQTSRTLLDLDQRIQMMRNDLAAMMQQANAQMPSGQNLAWPQGREAPTARGAPNGDAAPGWSAFDPFVQGGYGRGAAPVAPVGGPGPIGLFGTPPGAPFGAAPFGFNAPMQGRTQQIEPHHVHSMQNVGGAGAMGGASGMMGQAGQSARDLGKMPPMSREPAGDVIDLGQEFEINLDMPGVKKDDLDIMVTDRTVIVTGQVVPGSTEGFVVVSERPPIQYRRTITLPSEIQTSDCQAKLKDGVLSITVPKKVPTDGPRHINVAYA